MQTIEAGKLSDIVNKLFGSFLKSLEGMFDDQKISESKGKLTIFSENVVPIKDENGEELPANSAVFEVVITAQWPKTIELTHKEALAIVNDREAAARIFNDAESIRLDMQFQGKNRFQKSNITKERLNAEIDKYISKYNIRETATKRMETILFLFNEVDRHSTSETGDETNSDTNASNKLNVSLRKIVGKTETSIRLVKINANYNIIDAMNDLDTIISDDDFVDQLPEGEDINYEITSDETDYDVNECEDFNCCDTLIQLIFDTLSISSKLRVLGVSGLKDSNGYGILENFSLSSTFDSILAVLRDNLQDEGCQSLPEFGIEIDPQMFTSDGSLGSTAASLIDEYLQTLGVVYDCISRGSQYKLDPNICYLEDISRNLKEVNT